MPPMEEVILIRPLPSLERLQEPATAQSAEVEQLIVEAVGAGAAESALEGVAEAAGAGVVEGREVGQPKGVGGVAASQAPRGPGPELRVGNLLQAPRSFATSHPRSYC